MDRPRRSTRNSVYASQPSSAPSSAPSTPNPYKKPTYLANRATPTQADNVSTPRGRGRGRGRGGRSNGATPTGRGRPSSARPECVATRVESRRSTGESNTSKNSKKKKRGAYNSQDYHYGSDFDSDQNVSDQEEPLDEVLSEIDGVSDVPNDDSDSDFSISLSTPRQPPPRIPSPPVPLWMDTEKVVEELELPKSSDDLLLDRDLVMKAVAIYEPLRRFHQIVRLSPFRFEDFCAALGTDETSALLNEIHIQLLKTILREEDSNQTAFGPLELKDSCLAVLFFIDNLTWPECLRSYVESDPKWSDVLKEISSVEYPFCGPQIRIKILSWMVDQFLATGVVRETLVLETIKHDDFCRYCGRVGEVIMCETCPAVYHLNCIVLKDAEEPPDDWKCPICVKNDVPGISDCASELEKAGLLIRHEKLGNDRHGRKYWFLARRVLVESEDGSSVWYYTTPLQVEELLYRLDEENYEVELVENIRNCKEEIVRQMEITEKITDDARGHRKTYIEAENAFLTKIHEERELVHLREIEAAAHEEEKVRSARRLEEDKKAREEEEERTKEELERKRIREERLHRRNLNKFTDYKPGTWSDDKPPDLEAEGLQENHCDDQDDDIKEELEDFKDEILTDSQIANAETQIVPLEISNSVDTEIKTEPVETKIEKAEVDSKTEVKTEETIIVKEAEAPSSNNRRKSRALLLDWDTEERMTRLKATGLYKLGHEGNYRTYSNLYNSDVLALSKPQHTEEASKKRTVSHKFSLTPASEVKWNSSNNNSNGLRSNMVSSLRAALSHLESAVPIVLMHPNWPNMRKAWVTALSNCATPKDFSKAMITLYTCFRPCLFNTVWYESQTHHKLMRISALEKEERKKAEKRDKKDRDDEEDRLRLLPQFVKYSIYPKHQVFKQKGEEYRLHGRWGWIWMSSTRRCKPQDARQLGLAAGPNKHVIQVKNETGKVKTILIDPNVFEKLMAKRSSTQRGTPTSSPMKTPTAAASPSDAGSNEAEKQEEPKEDLTSASETEKMEVEDEINLKSDVKTEMAEDETPMEIDRREKDMEAVDQAEKPEPQPSEDNSESVKKEENEGDKDQPSKIEAIASEMVKPEVKEPKEEPPCNSSASIAASMTSSEDPKGRKFKTELINVSLGIVGANRIIYPKIAHKSHFLDSLLARRERLERLETIELLETFGQEKLDQVKAILDNGGKIVLEEEEKEEKDPSEDEVLDETFPLGGIYKFHCYSQMCQTAAAEFKNQTTKKIRDYEYQCYSPMCRLKFFMQDSTRKKEERIIQAEKARLEQLVKDVQSKRMFTKPEPSGKFFIKKFPEEEKSASEQPKYPVVSTFRSGGQPSIFILPKYELSKLARSAGRTFLPGGFAAALKNSTWSWPYPCGRPLFKTGWQYKAVLANTLAAAALQLRILWASIRWDDIQTKPPLEGKHVIQNDLETITSEILNHRIVGRFLERYQYLKRKTIEPIDSPKVIRAAKARDSSEVTPSRSGLRKRKLAEMDDRSDPVVSEEWVGEDQVEIWEIKFYHDRMDRKIEPYKPGTPSGSTRTKSGVTLKQPDKYDPSAMDKEKAEKEKLGKTSKEMVDTELRMQRAVHLSKRDHHVKTPVAAKNPTPTASQQLQQQQAAAGLPSNPRSYGGVNPNIAKKVNVVATSQVMSQEGAPTTSGTVSGGVGILNRKAVPLVSGMITTPRTSFIQASPLQQQRITLFRTVDGRFQVRGLLPGQTMFESGSVPGQPQTQQFQIISGGQILQQGAGQSQIVMQGLSSGGQLANIGGHNVIVKKVIKPATPTGNQPIRPTGQTQVHLPAHQLQQLLGSGKVMRMDPKTGALTIGTAPTTMQTTFVTGPPPGSTTVTKTPGLPISIVSPSKTPKVDPSLFPSSSVQSSVPSSIVRAVSTIRSPTVMSSGVSFPSSASTSTTFIGGTISTPASVSSQSHILQPQSQTQTIVIQSSGAGQLQHGQIMAGQNIQGQVLLQNLGGGQLTTIGGQNVIVKKIVNKNQPGGQVVQVAGSSALQLQQLLASGKVIRVDPKSGVMNMSASTLQQLQLQQQSTGGVVGLPASSVATTKAQALPFSIVSPTKTTNVVPSAIPSPMVVRAVTPTVSAIRGSVPSVIATTTSAPVQKPMETQLLQDSPGVMAPKPCPGSPAKIAAQFVEAADGPRVIVTGIKTADLTQQQIQSLHAQICKQLQEHPALKDKFKGDSVQNSIKIIIQATPTPAPVPVITQTAQTPRESVIAVKSPAGSPLKSPARDPSSQSPLTGTSSSQILSKSPPNSANIDAAIAAVASDVDAPILPAPPAITKSPRKTPHSSITAYQSQSALEDPVLINMPALTTTPTKSPKKSPKKIHQSPVATQNAAVEEVVISSTEEVVNEVEVSENKGDAPRFILSQDLVGQAQMSPQAPASIQQLIPAGEMFKNEAPFTKTGSSRRKSPVKAKQFQGSDSTPILSSPPKKRISMSQMASPQHLSNLHVHKEQLRQDMTKKRILLERDLGMDVRKEVSKEIAARDNGIPDRSDSEEPATITSGKKRKSGESKGRKRTSSESNSKASSAKKPKAGHQLLCVCKTEYDSTQFYIGCDVCSNWFHLRCIGLTEADSRRMDSYVCESCKPSDKLYCLCRQPYDEAGFYVGCDKCQDWFHGRCIGILPVEGDAIEQYFCPKCDPSSAINHSSWKDLSAEDYAEISATLKQIKQQKSAIAFMKPVNVAEAPNYYKVIKEPMDLTVVSQRVEQKMYTKLVDFIGDINKIFENCRYFNPPESAVFKNSKLLEKFFAQKLGHLRAHFAKQK